MIRKTNQEYYCFSVVRDLVVSYIKGIFYAITGRVEFSDYTCRPTETEIDLDEFTNHIATEYADALEILAE